MQFGLIPARAGKTTKPTPSPWTRAAHPRACGENEKHTSNADILAGSSPRVRGKLLILLYASNSIRLIPARAGKT